MSALDDLSLLQFFVSGGAVLEANANLRIEPLNQLRQLFTTRGMLLATADDQTLPPSIHLRPATKYTKALHQTLLENDFVPIDLAKKNKIVRYEYHPVPNGYSHACDVASRLWKKWWKRPDRFRKQKTESPGFMILHAGGWHAIQEIVLNRSTLYITSSHGESILQGNDQVIWLEQDEKAEATVFLSTHDPAKRSAQVMDVHNSQSARLSAKSQHPRNSTRPICPALTPVVKHSNGKYYIKTAIGDVVVSGGILRCGVCRKTCKRSDSPVSLCRQ